jgi:hypothetical protein
MKVLDLDVLKPKPVLVKIGGKEIDVSFVPCGVTFEIDGIMQDLSKITVEDVQGNPESARRAFELTVRLCAAFCTWKAPELTFEWFMTNADAAQVREFANMIREALERSYAGIEEYGKKK